MTTTWRKGLAAAMREHTRGYGDDEVTRQADPGPIIACTLTDAELDVEFDDGYGGTNGKEFTAWTPTRVYFPICYDGSEWVGSAPRDPCDEATEHQGGG